MDTVNLPAKFDVRSCMRSWDNSNWRFGGYEPQSWARGGCRGSGMVKFERALVISYRPSIVTIPLSLRVSEILLQHATFSYPTSVFSPKISPCSPVNRWLVYSLGYKERRCVGLDVVQLVSKISNLYIMWSWSTNVTDGRRDGRTDDIQSQYCPLHYIAVM